MDKGLKNYLESCEKADIDEKILIELRQPMLDAIPEIMKSIQEHERVATKIRFKNITAIPPY